MADEQRYIFSGGYAGSGEEAAAVRRAKPSLRRKHSTFNIVSILFGTAVVSLLYTGNVITVSQLMTEIHQLELKHEKLRNEINQLHAEIDHKSASERIRPFAVHDLGMTDPKEAPSWFTIDPSALGAAEQK